ncbi:MAG: glutamate-cysteine ligase family protein [Gemmatimonadales bacterium]
MLASGARISFEPGGQIEISSARHATASELIAELHSITTSLIDLFDRNGIRLEARGVDPWNDITRIPLQLHRQRYATMTQYFESLHPSGARMMRQTASVQVSVDAGTNPIELWTLLNALAPYLVAIFSNSSRYAAAETGHMSYRTHLWRTLDPSRTGAAVASTRPVGEYAMFALNAGAMFAPPSDGRYPSFLEWLSSGEPTKTDWDLHASTLFPEVRPKGFFEVRSPDMVDPRMIAAPIAFIAGLAYDETATRQALQLLARSGPVDLVAAGRDGMRNSDIASVANELANLAIAGCRTLGESYISHEDLDTLVEFVDRYTRNGRSPADDQ